MIETHAITCPYCWETVLLELDLSAGSQRYVEDCRVCCQPIVVDVRIADDASYVVDVAREND